MIMHLVHRWRAQTVRWLALIFKRTTPKEKNEEDKAKFKKLCYTLVQVPLSAT
jgi:hypothetical protein